LLIREKVEAEIEDLTASLFEEANKMVYEANLKQDRAEKKLAAAEGKVSGSIQRYSIRLSRIALFIFENVSKETQLKVSIYHLS